MRLGGKASALAALDDGGFPVPAWFVVTPDALCRSLSEKQREELEKAAAGECVANSVSGVTPDQATRAEIESAVEQLCGPKGRVAVRSSAVDEDGAQHSFAGLLDRLLVWTVPTSGERCAGTLQNCLGQLGLAELNSRGCCDNPLTGRDALNFVR